MHGKYPLIKKLAVGGMGEVFLARMKGPVGAAGMEPAASVFQRERLVGRRYGLRSWGAEVGSLLDP